MKQELLKYRHHLLLIAALLLLKVVTEPLWQQQQVQRDNNALIKKQVNKAQHLLNNQQQLDESSKQQQQLLIKLSKFTFAQASEASFKLAAQAKLEQVLTKANCNVERIGWEGVTQISPTLNRWQLETRFSGEPMCLLNVTRALEALSPIVNISSYYYNGDLNGEPRGKGNARLQLQMWQYTKEADL